MAGYITSEMTPDEIREMYKDYQAKETEPWIVELADKLVYDEALKTAVD